MESQSILVRPCVQGQAVPLTAEQYHALDEAGQLNRDVELLWGMIVRKMSKSPLHTYVVSRLTKILTSSLQEGFHLRKEEPLTIGNSEPEPDVAIVRGSPENYLRHHPATAELVIEVAISSVDLDREKAELYAEANVGEYWLVLPSERSVTVYSQAKKRRYQTIKTVGTGGELFFQGVTFPPDCLWP